MNTNRYYIPETFTEILHNFTREIIRYKPKDILDFSFKYFYFLEKGLPFLYEPNQSNPIENNNNKENDLFQNNDDKKELSSVPPLMYIQKINQGVNTPINSEESRNSNKTNGSGIARLSKNFVNEIIEQDLKNKALNNDKEAFLKETNENNNSLNKYDEELNKTGETFNNISGVTEDKNEIRHFIGTVIENSIKYTLEEDI